MSADRLSERLPPGFRDANPSAPLKGIKPRLGAKKNSKQFKATNLITANKANGAPGGAGGAVGNTQVGTGGSPGGAAGQAFPGNHGTAGTNGSGFGGGLNLSSPGTAVIDDTTISANQASTGNNDVAGTFTT